MFLRTMFIIALGAMALVSGSHVSAQGRGTPPEPLPPGQTTEPFPQPIEPTAGVITVTLREFASLPDIDGVAARMMTLVEEPASKRLFISDMRGPLYTVSADGKVVVSASWDNTLKVWDAKTGVERVTLRGHYGLVNRCALSADGKTVVSESSDKTL